MLELIPFIKVKIDVICLIAILIFGDFLDTLCSLKRHCLVVKEFAARGSMPYF